MTRHDVPKAQTEIPNVRHACADSTRATEDWVNQLIEELRRVRADVQQIAVNNQQSEARTNELVLTLSESIKDVVRLLSWDQGNRQVGERIEKSEVKRRPLNAAPRSAARLVEGSVEKRTASDQVTGAKASARTHEREKWLTSVQE